MMRYFTLRLTKPEGEVLFESDFLVDRFEGLVREMTSILAQQRLIDERSSARIIPRTDGNANFERPTVLNAAQVADNSNGTLDILFEGSASSGQPLTYMTLQIHSLEQNIVYRFDWRLDAILGTLLIEVAQLLLDEGKLIPGDRFLLYISAHQDGRPRIDPLILAKPLKAQAIAPTSRKGVSSTATSKRDEVPVADHAEDAELEILVESVEELIKPQPKSLSAYAGAEAAGNVSDRDLPIYVRRGAMQRALRAAGVSARVDEEVGGFLLGNVFQDPHTERLFVEIAEVVEADQARGTYVSIDFDYNAWRQVLDRIANEFPDKILIGWYHTHLVSQAVVLPLQENGNEYAVLYQPFFSQPDLFIHRNFFPNPWYVALVMDLRCKQDVFFGWRDGQVARIGGYYLYGD